MSYTIKFTNGKTLAVIADQSVDQVSTSLTLVGKNINNYGEYLNTNFVGLLENFAGLTEPLAPITGQTWYDTSENRLKVYTTGTFKPVGSPIISNVAPTNPVKGDLWVDTNDGILKWWNGSEWILAGKGYSDTTGLEGWQESSIFDYLINDDVPTTEFYSSGERLAIMTTSTINIDPLSSQVAYYNTSTIRPGLTLNPIFGAKFYGTATSAETVAGFDPSTILTDTEDLTLTGKVDVFTDYGIRIGTETDIALFVSTSGVRTSVLGARIQDQPFEIRYNTVSSGTNAVAFHIDSTNSRVGIRNKNPLADVDILGNVVVRGGLTVIGTQTSIEVNVVKVKDINIELATGQTTATNNYVAGGGITLHGATDHLFTYTNAIVNSVQLNAWQPNIDLNLATGSLKYMISGTSVLLADSGRPGQYRLGDLVTAAPGLVNLPVLSQLTVSNVLITGTTISTLVNPAVTDLILAPSSGQVDLNYASKIIHMPDPTTGYDGANKRYVDNELALQLGGSYGRKPYTLSIDITDFGNVDEQIVNYLDLTLPIDGYGDTEYSQPDGSRCSVLCTKYVETTATYYIDNLNTSTVRQIITYVPSIGATATNTATIVTDFELAGSITITSPPRIIERTVRLYQVLAGAWTFIRQVNTEYLTSYDSIYVADLARSVKFNSVAPTTSSLTSISLPSVVGIRTGHFVVANPLTAPTTVVSVNTAANRVEITPAMGSLLPAATTVTFAYSPGATIYMSASGPATLGTGTTVTIQDKTTLLNLLTGTLISRSTSSYLTTMTVGIAITDTSIGSTGTYSNWLISLGGA
jgi:hypothetical protein